MADGGGEREALLRREYLGQTARVRWHELQAWYARGCVINVAGELDLVEIAVQLGLDNKALFEQLTGEGQVAPMSETLARAWYKANPEVWAVVAPPWVLVQQRAERTAAD